MQPSSLIFVLVIAIWAAYLLQHWLRRREHLSTARTIDRFSASMRVLDRTKAGRSSASGGMSTTGSIPLHRRSAGLAVREVAGGDTMAVPVPAGASSAAPSGAGARRIAGVALPSRSRAALSTMAIRRPIPRVALRRAGGAAWARPTLGLTLLGAAGVAGVGLLLALFGAASWLIPVVALVIAGGALVGLRRLAAQDVSRRMAAQASPSSPARSAGRTRLQRGMAAEAAFQDSALQDPAFRDDTSPGAGGSGGRAAPAARRRVGSRPAASTRPGGRRAAGGRRGDISPARVASARESANAGATTAAGEPAAYAQGVVGARTSSAKDEVFDLITLETTLAEARGVPAPVEGGWSPVPVPPPTYTLKAKAVYAHLDEDDDVVSPYAPVADLAERRRLASG